MQRELLPEEAAGVASSERAHMARHNAARARVIGAFGDLSHDGLVDIIVIRDIEIEELGRRARALERHFATFAILVATISSLALLRYLH